MTQTGIEAFLAICRHRNISKAAVELFVSQSSLSIRIKNLEKELGCALFLRNKGSHEMILTEEGKRFYKLSLQYQDIMRNMLSVGKRVETLRVSAINSVATYLLPPVYEQFMVKYPNIHLEFQDMIAVLACNKLVQGETDLAFTAEIPETEQVTAETLLKEPMVLICAEKSWYPDQVSPEVLPVEHEVYVEWSNEFARWHKEHWGEDAVPQIQLEIMGQLQSFITRENNWAIVPQSVACGLANVGIRQIKSLFSIPERKIYALRRRGLGTKNSKLFLDIAYESFGTWMKY